MANSIVANPIVNPIETAGEDILKKYCGGFPSSSSSYIIPAGFCAEFPEARDMVSFQIQPASRGLTSMEYDKLVGISGTQKGEFSEYAAYNMLHKLICEKQTEKLLAIRTFSIDNNNRKQIKRRALIKYVPNIKLTGVKTDGEYDFVVVVQNLGLLLIEVKANVAPKAMVKAEKQLKNANLFFTALMRGIEGSTSAILPCAKLIIVANERSPSPTSKTAEDSYLIHNDLMVGFAGVWKNILQDLRNSKRSSTFTVEQFETFTRIIVGLWAMKQVFPGFAFSRDEASTVAQTALVDRTVDKQQLSSDYIKVKSEAEKAFPVSNVSYCEQPEIFRKTKEIELLYLNPQQKQLYDCYPRVIVRGHPGTGKTVLCLFKVIEIAQKDVNEKILLLAPNPHHLRCQKILTLNNINCKIINKFPPSGVIKDFKIFFGFQEPQVLIVTLRDFFAVSNDELSNYNLRHYNIFLDDFQSYQAVGNNVATYSDISTFVDTLYESCVTQKKYMWICMDVMQSQSLDLDDKNVVSLLYSNPTTLRQLTTPIFELTDILRNTKEIIQLISYAREERIKKKNVSSNVIGQVNCGHSITCVPVVWHQLDQWTDLKESIAFIVQMVENELDVLFKQTLPLQHKDVAILFDGGYKSDYEQKIEDLLNKKYNCSKQTISESLTNNNVNDIVYDDVHKSMSYEVPCLLYINMYAYVGEHDMYVLCSRARTRLVIINPNTSTPPNDIAHTIKWKKEMNGTYQKL